MSTNCAAEGNKLTTPIINAFPANTVWETLETWQLLSQTARKTGLGSGSHSIFQLREWLSRGCSISYQHWPQECWCRLQRDREWTCREAWGEACWQERDLAGVTAVWRTSQCLRVTLEAISDHCTGPSFKYINMVLHQRDFEEFLMFHRAQNICT